MTSEDFRRLALDLDATVEASHMGHPDFRVNGRIFATLHADDAWGTVKLTPEEQQEFIRSFPAVFVPAAGAWGRQGYTNVALKAATTPAVRGAMLLAWQNTAAKPRARRSSPSASKVPPRKRRV
ncbi:MAG: MmcQ/YjbR family DNA-binding protein [Acidobacteria bacterium]|nr:MmcQ/YjbR family DNA-binding protein [Acidobacteriota bacterium]